MNVVRGLVFSDLPNALKIERESFPTPWSAAMFLLELGRKDSICLAADVDGALAGYVIASRLDSEWHLMSIAVAPTERRHGIASSLIGSLLAELEPDSRITLEVRPTNEAAISLYKRVGFLAAGRRRAYYPDTGEDALIMWRTEATLRGSLDDVPNPDPSFL
jgi:[ribosomal protein S18]-alanine N-acetyltransferase